MSLILSRMKFREELDSIHLLLAWEVYTEIQRLDTGFPASECQEMLKTAPVMFVFSEENWLFQPVPLFLQNELMMTLQNKV